MNEAIKYYQRKLDDANDLTGIAYVCKLIQLEHQPTIDNTLNGLKQVQYPRHFPNHLVVQLARLNRPEINEELIAYFKLHFKATNTEWHAIGALQDDRVVETVVNAINEYEKSYFSRKVVTRCIHLLGRIGSPTALDALQTIIEAYFQTNNHFIDNYEMPLASEALEAVQRIKLPEATQYLDNAERHYQYRIEQELDLYPARLLRDRTNVGIALHEGSALDRMRQYALPKLIEWHRDHPSEKIRDFALNTMIHSLQILGKKQDWRVQHAITYLLSQYEVLEAQHKLNDILHLVEHCKNEAIAPFAWRVLRDDHAVTAALNVLANQRAESVFGGIVEHLQFMTDFKLATRANIARLKAYINYFGQIRTPAAEAVLLDLYELDLPYLQLSICEALQHHAQERHSALRILDQVIETNLDTYTVKQTILLLPMVGKRGFSVLLSLLDAGDHRAIYAVEALGLLRDANAVPHLLNLLIDARTSDKTLQDAILKALERIGTDSAFAALNAWETST